jgi:hypothetical protein
MKREPPIYLPLPEQPRATDYVWLALGMACAIVTIAGMCVIAVEASAAWEFFHKGICS